MKILIIPLLLISLPIFVLFLIVKYWKKDKKIPITLKIVLGMVFIILGLVLTYCAIIVSMHGHTDKGIQCATGVVALIPIGLLVNFIGIPAILISEKNKRKTKEKL